MERQRCVVCFAKASESIFMDSENEPLGDLGELEEDEIDDDGVGGDEVADNTHDHLPVIPSMTSFIQETMMTLLLNHRFCFATYLS